MKYFLAWKIAKAPIVRLNKGFVRGLNFR